MESDSKNVSPTSVLDIMFRIPSDLFKQLFEKFLCLSSIFSFDSAMTNKKQREIYLIMLINCPILIDYLARRWIDQIKIMTWITKRKVLCKNFRIQFWNTTNLTSSVLSYFKQQKTRNNIQSLTICAFQKTKMNLDDAVCPILIKQYCSGLENLEKLSLVGICTRIKPYNRNRFDHILKTIVQSSNKKMETIKLVKCSISLLSLDSIANNCPNLKKLQLIQSYYTEYIDCIDSEFINSNSNDTKFDYVSDDDSVYHNKYNYFQIDSFSCIVQKCLQLKTIDLSFCKLEINTITYILNYCYNLETIILEKIYIADQNTATISCFKNVKQDSLKLKSVDISRNNFLENHDVCALFLKCPNLINFSIEEYPFDDSMARSLSENCLNILKINISTPCLILISEWSLHALVHNCIHLEFINIDCCDVSDCSIIDIFENCLKLKVIKMEHNKSLTDACLINIKKDFIYLKEISFRGCKFTENGILSLLSKCTSNMDDFGCGFFHYSKNVVDELKKKCIKTKEYKRNNNSWSFFNYKKIDCI